MTFWDFLRAALRRWPIVLIGALITAGAGYLVIRDQGVYYTRTEMIFLAPTSTDYPNSLRTQSDDIIVTAGIVAKLVSGPGKVTKFASPDVTLVGIGVKDGWSLRLPDTGGQWASNYATQTLVLDIVAPTRAEVEKRQSELTQRIADELLAFQQREGVDPVNMITAMVAPETTIIFHVGGSRPRALAMVAMLGVGATAAVVLFVEVRSRRTSAVEATPRRRPVLSPAE